MHSQNLIENIQISGHGVDTGEAFQNHAREIVQERISKYWENPIGGKVILSKTKHLFHAEVIFDIGYGNPISGEAEAEDPYKSLHDAVEKCAKQLRRFKKKVRDSHN